MMKQDMPLSKHSPAWASRIFLLVFLSLCCSLQSLAQQRVNVLFIGNSYTDVNNLPQMVQLVASSMGDQLTWQGNTPGGCTFQQHCNNQSMTMICNGGWDIVVLQEQSQYPSFPQPQVEAEVFPYAQRLVDSVYAHNPCCEPMFYMTWGRKNGDAGNAPYFPVLGTYEGMDSMLCERYTYMAQQYDAALCPVGRVWRYLRERHADIELYQSDESHPSEAGTYAAACAFYTLFFHRDPDSISFSASLPEVTARTIRMATRRVVYEHISRWQRPRPQASFDVLMPQDHTVRLTSTSIHSDSLSWDFGDGSTVVTTADATTVEHAYQDTGTFIITLVASRHCMMDTFSTNITVIDSTVGISPNLSCQGRAFAYPNPAGDYITISLPRETARSTATIFSLDGRVISGPPTSTAGKSVSVDLHGIPDGDYFLWLTTAGGSYSSKIAIRH